MNARCRFATVASVLLVACSGDDTTSSVDLAGTWNVTRYELVSTTSSPTRVDLIALGATAQLVMRSDGTYQLTMTGTGAQDETGSGTWSASSDVVTITRVGMSGQMQFNYSLSGSTLTLVGADTEWDFNGDGVDEPAKLNMTVVKG
jgi:hypothetical protein